MEKGSVYRLYSMDQELWLANVSSKNHIWSIYSLCPTKDIKTGSDGQLIMPTEAPYVYQEGFQLELCNGVDVLEPVLVSDKKSMKLLQELIDFYEEQTVRYENVDVFTVGDYFRFYDASGKEDTLYYVFMNPSIDDKPQMLSNKDARAKVQIALESYEGLCELWESLRPLPDSIKPPEQAFLFLFS